MCRYVSTRVCGCIYEGSSSFRQCRCLTNFEQTSGGGGGISVASLPAPAQLSITCSKAVDSSFMRRKSLGMRLGAMSDQINDLLKILLGA